MQFNYADVECNHIYRTMIYYITYSADVPIGKAGQDLYILDLILSGVQTCVDKYSLDERLRTEYKTIEEMEKIQDKFCYNDGRQTMGVTPENIIMSNLKSDRAGIIADVLIKHRVIKDVEELYEKNNYSV